MDRKFQFLHRLLKHQYEKLLWKYYNKHIVYEKLKKTLAIRLVLSLDIEEAIQLVKEKLPQYSYPVDRDSNLKLIEQIRFNYLWENIDYQRARSLILRLGIPEPYVLLAEFLLRDNGVTPF